MQDAHFLCPKKLSKYFKKKMDKEVVKNIQSLTEKMLLDIVNRTAILSKYKGLEEITPTEISFVVEKDFDYSFGMREISKSSPLPSGEHVEKMAEISRQNKY